MNTPLANLILQYRKISAILSKSVNPLLSSIKNNKVYGTNITYTTSGRITMQEPSIQNIARDFSIDQIEASPILISCRSIFEVPKGRCLISADFCQLELRILTHLSKDPTLVNVMKSSKDVFKMIAAKWNKINDEQVTEEMRNNTKQICYAIIYGMGSRTLSLALKTDEDSAVTLTETFHATYPGIRCVLNFFRKCDIFL